MPASARGASSSASAPGRSSMSATSRELFQRALDDALARVGGRVEAAGELLEGGVVDTLATLDRRDADLLVCGSRAYGPLRRVLLGGVSSRLLRRSVLPLLVVPRSGHSPGS